MNNLLEKIGHLHVVEKIKLANVATPTTAEKRSLYKTKKTIGIVLYRHFHILPLFSILKLFKTFVKV